MTSPTDQDANSPHPAPPRAANSRAEGSGNAAAGSHDHSPADASGNAAEGSQAHSSNDASGQAAEGSAGNTLPKAPYTFRTVDGQVMEVPPEGTLGLLAAGYRGIMLWREARAASGWTPAKAAGESKAAFREYKQAAKAKTDQPESGHASGR